MWKGSLVSNRPTQPSLELDGNNCAFLDWPSTDVGSLLEQDPGVVRA